MSNYTFITSMNQAYWDHIGKYMILSFLKYAPLHFKIHLYAEDITAELPQADNLIVHDWNVDCNPSWEKFAANTQDAAAQKFGKKGWASIHAWENIEADRLVWLDADLLFLKEFNEEIFDLTLPEGKLIGLFDHNYIAVKRGIVETQPSAETGYVILDCNHKSFKSFVKQYRETYELPEKPDTLYRWWDNQICMLVANNHRPHVYDLSELRNKGAKTQTPLNHSPLAEYFIHQKGKSKKNLNEDYFKGKTNL